MIVKSLHHIRTHEHYFLILMTLNEHFLTWVWTMCEQVSHTYLPRIQMTWKALVSITMAMWIESMSGIYAIQIHPSTPTGPAELTLSAFPLPACLFISPIMDNHCAAFSCLPSALPFLHAPPPRPSVFVYLIRWSIHQLIQLPPSVNPGGYAAVPPSTPLLISSSAFVFLSLASPQSV